VHASAKKAGDRRSVGGILRYWRGRKKMSQMELALTVDVSTAFDLVVARFAGEKALKRHTNVYRLTFATDGLRDAVRQWPVVEQFLLARLLGEAVATQDRGLFDLHAEMAALGSGPSPADNPTDQGLPIFSFTLGRGGLSASFFSTITTFGTPLDVTAQELRIESLFPADEATRQWLRKGAGKG
jgi:hypothetical protein